MVMESNGCCTSTEAGTNNDDLRIVSLALLLVSGSVVTYLVREDYCATAASDIRLGE